MKKAISLVLILVLALSVLGGCAKKESAAVTEAPTTSTEAPQKSIEITFASIMAGDCFSNQSVRKFVELVDERSKGRIKVNFFSDGSLGSEVEQVQMIKTGEIEMAYFGSNFGALMCPKYDLTILPYLFQTVEDARDFYMKDPVMKPLIDKAIKDSANCYLISINNRPPHVLGSKKKLTTVDTLKGFKLRIPEIAAWSTVWGGMGAMPTVVAWAEVYTALQTGVIDGDENPVDTKYSGKTHEVVDYIVNTNHIYDVWHWTVNADFWDNLDNADRELIQKAATDACLWGDEALNKGVDKQIEEIKGTGVEFIDPVNPKDWVKAALPYVNKYIKENMAQEAYDWTVDYLNGYGLSLE